MDYEEEEYNEEEEPQVEDMEIDDEDAPYLDLRGARERQAYALLKNRTFGNTKAYDPDLLEKIGLQGAGPEEKPQHHHILHHHMKQEDHHGTAQAPTSGHDRPQAAGPPAPAPVGFRTSHVARLQAATSAPSPSS